MLRAEWTIIALQAVLLLAQLEMKYQYFVPELCKPNAIFSGASHQNRSYLGNFRHTCDILTDSSKGTAAAKWQMNISR